MVKPTDGWNHIREEVCANLWHESTREELSVLAEKGPCKRKQTLCTAQDFQNSETADQISRGQGGSSGGWFQNVTGVLAPVSFPNRLSLPHTSTWFFYIKNWTSSSKLEIRQGGEYGEWYETGVTKQKSWIHEHQQEDRIPFHIGVW